MTRRSEPELRARTTETTVPAQAAASPAQADHEAPAAPEEAREAPVADRVEELDAGAVDVHLAEQGLEGRMLVLVLDKPDRVLEPDEPGETLAASLVLSPSNHLLVLAQERAERKLERVRGRAVEVDLLDPGPVRLDVGERGLRERGEGDLDVVVREPPETRRVVLRLESLQELGEIASVDCLPVDLEPDTLILRQEASVIELVARDEFQFRAVHAIRPSFGKPQALASCENQWPTVFERSF